VEGSRPTSSAWAESPRETDLELLVPLDRVGGRDDQAVPGPDDAARGTAAAAVDADDVRGALPDERGDAAGQRGEGVGFHVRLPPHGSVGPRGAAHIGERDGAGSWSNEQVPVAVTAVVVVAVEVEVEVRMDAALPLPRREPGERVG
jgi:hypothetical protein